MILTGTPVFRARRIEAGLMSQAEFDSATTPFDPGLGHFVQMDKPEFIGKAALQKADKRSRTTGMRVRGRNAKRGRTITIGGDIVGRAVHQSGRLIKNVKLRWCAWMTRIPGRVQKLW